MKASNGFLFALATGFIILAVATAIVAIKEIFVARQAPNWDAETILDQNVEALLAYSTRADYAVIDACLRMTGAVESRILPSVARVKRAQKCQQLMRKIVRSSGQNAYAWFALAQYAQFLGQSDEMNRALERSYLAGPNEQWIAEQRVVLAEAALGELSSAALLRHTQDLAMLVQSDRGIRAIAERYVREPGFRDRITTIVSGLDSADQKRFLTRLQRHVRGY